MENLENKSNKILRLFGVLSIFTIVSWIATQYFATKLNYQTNLGGIVLYSNDKYTIYQPFQVFFWYMKFKSIVALENTFKTCFMILLYGNAILLSIALVYSIYFKEIRLKYSTAYGSARWSTFKEIQKMDLLNDTGVVVGGYYKKAKAKYKDIVYLIHKGMEHILVYAPTRSGKGVALILPTLLKSWHESVVVTDIKGELFALTSAARKHFFNNRIIKFDPSKPNSASFNILEEVRIGSEYETSDIQNIAQLLVDPDGKGAEDHWSKSAFALLTGLISFNIKLLMYFKKRETDPNDELEKIIDKLNLYYPKWKDYYEMNLSGIDNMLASPFLLDKGEEGEEIVNLWTIMAESSNVLIRNTGVDMMSRPPNELGSVLSTTKNLFNLYRDPIISENTKKSTFRIADLMNSDKPTSLYILTYPSDKDRLRPLVRLLLNMIVRIETAEMKFIEGRGKSINKYRQLFVMDEFPSLGKMPVIQESLAFVAGYGIKFFIITQDITQLRNEQMGYGKDEVISSNVHLQVIFPPNRQETAEYISK